MNQDIQESGVAQSSSEQLAAPQSANQAPAKDDMIVKFVEKIWSKYDSDNNGYLDKNESKKFVRDTLDTLGSIVENGFTFDEDFFNQCFQEFDTNGNGRIDFEEMA